MSEFREDIQAAVDRMAGTKFGVKKELKNLPMRLYEGELVLALAAGQYGNGQGVLVLTDERILFVQQSLGSAKIEDFPLDRVSSVQESTGMVMGEIKIFASGNDARIKSVAKQDASAFADAARKHLRKRQTAAAAPAPTAVPPAVDPLDQLKKLAELRDAGIISADEFEAKKTGLMALV